MFVQSSDETSLPHPPSAIPRGLCSLQRQSVRLQSTCPWCPYSGGPTSADHPAGKMRTNRMILFFFFLDHLEESHIEWLSTQTFICHCGSTHQQRSVLQAAKRIQTGHINNLQSVHINPEVNRHAAHFLSSCRIIYNKHIQLKMQL